MDNVKIGNFIAEMRKAKKWTQKDLAEKLYVTDRAVSNWECGKRIPEVSIMPALCKFLGITVSDLLNGGKIMEQEKTQKAEEQIIDLLRERQGNKRKIAIASVIAFIGLAVAVSNAVLAAYLTIDLGIRIFMIIFGILVLVACLILTILIDYKTGYYECRNCHERFIPTKGEFMRGLNTITMRRLKCPHCGEVTWCKRRLNK